MGKRFDAAPSRTFPGQHELTVSNRITVEATRGA